jgi:hypothetical protein
MRELRHSRALDAPAWPKGAVLRSSLSGAPIPAAATARAETAESTRPTGGTAMRLRPLDRRDAAACRRLIAGHAALQTADLANALARIATLEAARPDGTAIGLALDTAPDGQLLGWILFRLAEDGAAELHFCFDGRVGLARAADALVESTPRAVRFLGAESLFAAATRGDPLVARLVGRLGLRPKRGRAGGGTPLRFQRDLALIL